MHPLRLVALDLDGTLLSSSKRISSRTANALRRVVEAGASVAFVTGRSPRNATHFDTPALGFSVHCVCHNGALILGPSSSNAENTRSILFQQTIPPETVRKITQSAALLDMAVTHHVARLSSSVRVLRMQSQAQRARLDAFNKTRYWPLQEVDAFQEQADGDDPVALVLFPLCPDTAIRHLSESVHALSTAIGETEAPAQLKDTINLPQAEGISLFNEHSFVDCMSASINKGVALRKLADMLDIRVIQTVCFGDGWNDMDMMHVAGLGFAMANGKEELKQVAHRVTRFSNDEDGVAVELEELLEQGLFASSI